MFRISTPKEKNKFVSARNMSETWRVSEPSKTTISFETHKEEPSFN